MPAHVVFAVYGSCAVLALLLLYFFRARRWYWHVLSLLLAMGIGLMPPPERWQGPAADLTIGGIFLFLFLWGILAPLFRKRHGPRQEQPHHA